MKKLKQEKGSITLFVLIAMLFFVLFLTGMYMLGTLGEQTGISETAKIKEIYEKDVNNIDDVYQTLQNGPRVNEPNFKNTGLTPITIAEDGTLTGADTTNSSWYSYDGKKNNWANAKTQDGSMFVWIPRFAYKITYTNNSDKSQGGTIDVVFLKDTTNLDFKGKDVTSNTYIDEKGQQGAYIVHPAFQEGRNNSYANGEWRKEITGFWIAKFEAGYQDANKAVDSNVGYSTIYGYDISGQKNNYTSNYYGTREVGTLIKYPTFQANKPSMNYIGIADSYNLCMSLNDENNPYGLTNKTDPHLTKNSEWGAVSYLAHSKYGRNGEEITINNISLNGTNTVYAVTGYGGNTISAPAITTSVSAIQNGTQTGSWITSQGQKASTTGNVYGVYDLSGGSWEWTAGYIAAGDNYTTYGENLIGESNEYKSKYAGTTTESTNYLTNPNTERLGEAIWEISKSGAGHTGWSEDDSEFFNIERPFSLRGGAYQNTTSAGKFSFYRFYGYGNYCICFRPVLIIN